MVRFISFAGAAALLVGCAARPASEPPRVVPAVQALPSPPEARISLKCDRIDPAIAVEVVAQTPLAAVLTGGTPSLSAALMASEARKNERLRQALAAYERCRQIR